MIEQGKEVKIDGFPIAIKPDPYGGYTIDTNTGFSYTYLFGYNIYKRISAQLWNARRSRSFSLLQKIRTELNTYTPKSMTDNKGVFESSIDFPKKDLTKEVWDKKKGTYVLAQKARKKIQSILDSYDDYDLSDIAEEIHVIGSICTNQYTEDSDIDVHIILKDDVNVGDEEEFQTAINDWSDELDVDGVSYLNKHPIHIYIQIRPDQEMMAEGLYDYINDKWIKSPTILPQDYNPYEDFKHVIDDVKDSVKDADVLFGDLKRNVIDYDSLQVGMKKATKEQKQTLLKTLQQKAKEIEEDIEKLYGMRKEWVAARKASSNPDSTEQALSDAKLAEQWKDANAEFKFINRYQYLKTIKDLEALIADDDVSKKDVEKIKDITNIETNE